MNKWDILAVLAVVFFLISPSLAFYVVPSMKRLPADLDEHIYYNGKLGMFNDTTLRLDYIDIEIVRHVKALREEGNVLIVREDIEVKNKQTGESIPELTMTKIYGIDPHTTENIEGYGDVDRLGYWMFPVGLDKDKEYLIWNTDLDDAFKEGYISGDEALAKATLLGEEERGGIKTYKYYGEQNDIFTGYLPILPEAKMYYSGYLFAWVEPKTGTIVDLQKHVDQYAAFPDLHKIPSNLNMSVYLSGNAKILNTTNGEQDVFNLTVCNHIEVESAYPDYYVIKNDMLALDENGRRVEELCSSSEDAVNPYTMEYIEMLSDKRGLMTFPVGVEKHDYMLWDSDIGDVSIARYDGEYSIGGLKTYRYVVNTENKYIGNMEIEGLSDRHAELYYSGNTTYYVEPTSGAVAYVEKEGKVYAFFPDLHTIPENFAGQIKMDGELWAATMGGKSIEMVRNVSVSNVYWEGKDKVLVIKDETTTYDKKTGGKIDLACTTEYHGVYADTSEEARNYGDMEREGLYTFPPGTEKRNYFMWNTEINAPSPVEFVREEDHAGVHTYLFETKENRMVKDTSLGMPLTVKYITTTYYWVEPNTGIIVDMKKDSVKKINLMENLIGARGPFWIDVYRLNLYFPEDTVNEMAEQAKQMMGLIKLSNSKVPALQVNLHTQDLEESLNAARNQMMMVEKLSGRKVKVMDLTYWATEKSVMEMAEEAEQAAFLLTFMQIILPAFLVLLGLAMIAVWIRKHG